MNCDEINIYIFRVIYKVNDLYYSGGKTNCKTITFLSYIPDKNILCYVGYQRR